MRELCSTIVKTEYDITKINRAIKTLEIVPFHGWRSRAINLFIKDGVKLFLYKSFEDKIVYNFKTWQCSSRVQKSGAFFYNAR